MSARFPARQAEPHQRFAYGSASGQIRRLKADGNGIVRPQSAEDERMLELRGLPVVRPTRRPTARRRAKRHQEG